MSLTKDRNRRKINFKESQIKEILPEFYSAEYPTLLNFIETYYDYLDSSSSGAFKSDINNIISLRDTTYTEEKYLDLIVSEIGNGLTVASFFSNPRLMTKLLSSFYKSKGSLVSIEGFFRAFFNNEVTVEYTKNKIFIVGESEIGAESQKFIKDNRLYQTFAILIKTGISVSEYLELYKRFVHPAGFFFAGEVILEETVLNTITTEGTENLRDSAQSGAIILSDAEGILTTTAEFSQLTGILESDGTQFRITLDVPLSRFEDIPAGLLDSIYSDMADLLSVNSFTMDDSDTISPDASITIETMDEDYFDER